MNEEEKQEVFGDILNEGEKPLEETETPPATPAENKPVADEPPQEGENTPGEESGYKARTSKRMEEILNERNQAFDKLREYELREKILKEPKEEVIPERWSKLFSTGDPEQDKEAYKLWQTMNQEEKAAWKAELLEELQGQAQKEQEETEKMTEAYEAQLDELEEERSAKKLPAFDRNELMKFITQRPIFRQDGQPDFATALELMEKKPANQARKTLAQVKPQITVGSKGYLTPDDLKGGFSAI